MMILLSDRLSISPPFNSCKFTRFALKYLDVIEVYPIIIPILNEVCNMLSLFTETVKIIPLHYRQWEKNPSNEFERCYIRAKIKKLICI